MPSNAPAAKSGLYAQFSIRRAPLSIPIIICGIAADNDI